MNSRLFEIKSGKILILKDCFAFLYFRKLPLGIPLDRAILPACNLSNNLGLFPALYQKKGTSIMALRHFEFLAKMLGGSPFYQIENTVFIRWLDMNLNGYIVITFREHLGK